MKIVLKTEAEYKSALRKARIWMDNPGRPLRDKDNALIEAIVAYEKIHHPI